MWIGLPAIALIVVAVGLRVGLPIYRQHVAVQEIERLGGTADCVHVGPQWLRDRVGDERMRLFDKVVNVRLSETQATDATLRKINGLTSLRWLDLDGTQVTDSGLAHLRGIRNLKWLWLQNTRVTDAGLAHLKGLPNLELLDLDDTHVTKAGVDSLVQTLPNISHIMGGP